MALTKQTAHRKDLNAGIGPMEHRYFATVATIIREMSFSTERDRFWVAQGFADRLANSYPRFDRARFLLACGV